MLLLLPITLAGGVLALGAVVANNRRPHDVSHADSRPGSNLRTACQRFATSAKQEIGGLGDDLNTLISDLANSGQALAQARPTIRQPATPSNLVSSLAATLQQVDNHYQQFMHQFFDPLFGAERDQQMHEISAAGGGLAISPYEKRLNHNIAASILMTGVALAASQHPVVVVVTCLPLALSMSLLLFQRAYRCIFVERKLKTPVVGAINIVATFLGGFYVASGLSFILYFLSEKLVIITQDRSHRKMVNIFGQQPRMVWAVIDGVEVEIPFDQVEVGTTLVIGAGQMIPVDGVITKGYASVDQHRLTGEAQPAEKQVGDRVLAATVVLAGKIYVEVVQTGKETAAAQIGEILNNTAGYQMSIESKAIQVANASLAPTLAVAGLAWLVQSFEASVAITNAAFGFNVKLTGPIAMLNYLNIAARKGMLVKDGRSLELLCDVDTVVFDKTGTLTLEQPHVAQIYLFNGVTLATLLAFAAAVEDRQTHPIARAIVNAAKEQSLTLPAINDARYEVGYGVKAWIGNRLIRIGSDRFMSLEGIGLPPTVAGLQVAAHSQGHSLVMVALDDELAGVIELEPTIRPEAAAIVADLHKRGKTVYIISGDQDQPTRTLAEKLGIDYYFANTLPKEKAGHVERLQAEGRTVCFVGDGINDSIALKKAQVSVSLRGATSVATDTAQIVLMDTTLNQLPTLFDLAGQFDANMKAGFAAAILPGFLIIGGVFVANLSIVGSMMLYNASLAVGVGVAMLPLYQHR
jgi:heavy metal translocating P-type ATPase